MKWMIIIVACCLLSGCQFGLEQSQRDLADLELLRQTAHNQFEITEFQVAALKAFMGDEISMLPARAIVAIDEAEKLALNYDPNTVTDTQLGQMYGYRALMFCEAVKEILRRYAPELLRYMP